jgi:hypothetical protein
MRTIYADDNERLLMDAGATWLRENVPQRAAEPVTRVQPSGPDGTPMPPPDAAGQLAIARARQKQAGAQRPSDAQLAGAGRGFVNPVPALSAAPQTSGSPNTGVQYVSDYDGKLAAEGEARTQREIAAAQAAGPGSFSGGYSDELARKNAETRADSLRFDARLAGGRRGLALLAQAERIEAAPREEQLARAGLENQLQLGAIRERGDLAQRQIADATARRGQDIEARSAIDLANIQGGTARDVARLNADSRVEAAEARAEARRIALSGGGAGGRAPVGYEWNPDGTLRAIAGGPADPKSKANEPLNEGQSKALAFGTRMLESGKLIDDLAAAGVPAPSIAQQLTNGRGVLGIAADALASPAQQQIAQAQRDYINAVLRRESGAVISDAEFENAARQYFVQPGDSKEVIAQKKKNRETATRGILADVPNADSRVRGILGEEYSLPAVESARQAEPPALVELRRRAANNPQLAERLRQMGY